MAMDRERLLVEVRSMDWSQPHTLDEVLEHLGYAESEMVQGLRDHIPPDRRFSSPEELVEEALILFWKEHPSDRSSPWGRMPPDEMPERTRDWHEGETA